MTINKFNLNNYTVETFRHYDGRTMYIRDAGGRQIYAHKFMGNARKHAERVINQF